DILEARSTMMVYLTLWGLLVFWNVHGINVFQPRTIVQHPRVFLLGLALTAVTILGADLCPDVLNFVAPSPIDGAAAVIAFPLATMRMHIAMQTRWFASRLWKLTAP